MPGSPLADLTPGEVTLADGKLVSKNDASRSVSIADAMRHSAVDRIEREETYNPSNDVTRANNTHAAIFAEVKVDEQLGVIRVTRVVSAIAAGRILNRKTASSQILGGVVWGIGMALHEETLIDHRVGRIMNANIADYHVPVNADVHDIQGHLRRRARRQQSASASRGSARSALSALRRRLRTRSTTRPESACATCRLRLISWCESYGLAEGALGQLFGTEEAPPAGRAQPVCRSPSVDQTSLASSVISALRTFETGQFFSASRAKSWKAASAIPDTVARKVRAERLIRKP